MPASSSKSGIFALVRSLSKAEKRYFKRFLSGNAGPQARMRSALFDTLLAAPADDAATLRAHWPLPEFPAHLPSLKTKLYNMVLKAQCSLYADRSVDTQLRMLLDQVQFLYEKGLTKDCEKRLAKAQALAAKFEREEVRLQLIQWERRVFEAEAREGQLTFFQNLLERETQCIARMQLQSTLSLLHERLRGLARSQQQIRTAAQRKAFEAIVEHPVLQAPPPSDHILANLYFYNTWGMFKIATGQVAAAFPYLHQAMEGWRAKLHFIAEMPELYLGILSNFLSACLYGDQNYPLFLSTIRETRYLRGLPPASLLKLQRVGYYHEFAYLMNFAGYEAGRQILPELETWLGSNRRKISHYILLVFYHNLSIFHFVNDDFKGAHKWMHKILQEPDGGERQDILDFARLFQLIIQYELGNMDLNEYLLRSARRYFKKAGKWQDFEALLLRSMGQLLAGERPPKDCFEALLEGLNAMRQAEGGANPLGLKEVTLWVQGKLAGTGTRPIWEKHLAKNREEAGR